MHRPLREPFYLRFWRLIRGLLFYNTVYWKKASDGLNLPTMSPEERERQRPERNMEIIRPRMRPRAHIEAARGGEVSHPPTISLPEISVPESPVAFEQGDAGEHSSHRSIRREEMEDGTEQIYVKRRRYKRRLVARGSAIDRGSFLARVFGKKD